MTEHTAESGTVLHDWEVEEGHVDIFAFEASGFHNGPRCRRCGRGFCHHCEPGCYTEPCDG